MFAFMANFFERLDEIAGISGGSSAAVWLERAAFVFLLLMFAAAPHSIAATQTAWITGMFLWVVRLFFRPHVKIKFGPLDWALWAFFLWSVVSSLMSYEPGVSLDRLRGAALFLIVYFVLYNLRLARAVYLAVFILVLSCMVNVGVTVVQRAMGRGVAVHNLRPDSPLAKAGLVENDAVFEVGGRKVTDPDEMIAALGQNDTSKVKAYHKDFDITVNVARGGLLKGASAEERLGFSGWGRTRNWRASGFYGHYTTYAEVLQLIASLVLGLIVAGFFSGRSDGGGSKLSAHFLMLAIALAGSCVALLLTVTRASQLALMVAGVAILLLGASRKWVVAAFAVGIPIAAVGLFVLQQSRDVGFFDRNDLSTQYRQMMWNDGLRLWLETPRHFIFGVGMDSIQKHWQEWGLFDKGWQPMGHFHSTPIQLLAERGLPALLCWLGVLGIYLWRVIRSLRAGVSDWRSRGILLGCLGGAIGFFTSGLVHYNLGDQEVAMVFYMLMGVALAVISFDAPSAEIPITS